LFLLHFEIAAGSTPRRKANADTLWPHTHLTET